MIGKDAWHSPIHGFRHLLRVIIDFGVNVSQLPIEMRSESPTNRRTNEAGSQVIHTVRLIALHDRKVLGDVVEEYL